jgi:hypothetical protein
VSGEGGTIDLGFFRDGRPTNTTLILEESIDGLTWSTLASSTAGGATTVIAGASVSEAGSPQASVLVTVPRTGTKNFYRLKVSKT